MSTQRRWGPVRRNRLNIASAVLGIAVLAGLYLCALLVSVDR
jgi:hypothetical protein